MSNMSAQGEMTERAPAAAAPAAAPAAAAPKQYFKGVVKQVGLMSYEGLLVNNHDLTRLWMEERW